MANSDDDNLIAVAFLFIGSYIVLSNNIFSLDSFIIFTITGLHVWCLGKIDHRKGLEHCILTVTSVNVVWWIFATYDYESIIPLVFVILHILLCERDDSQSQEEQAQSAIDEEDIYITDEEVNSSVDLRGLLCTLLFYLATILSTGHVLTVGITTVALFIFFLEREYEKKANKQRPFKVTIVEGNITEQKVDVIISTISTSMYVLHGTVAHAVLTAGGVPLQQDFNQRYPRGIQEGEIGETSGGFMPCRSVYHINLQQVAPPNHISFDDHDPYLPHSLLLGEEAVLTNHGDKDNENEIKEVLCGVINNCLQRASSTGKKSIAFPMLGTGVLDYSPDNVARCMFQTLDQFSTSHASTSIRDVRIVVLPSDQKNIRVLKAAKADYEMYSTASTESSLPPGWSKMKDEEFYIRVPLHNLDTEYRNVASAFSNGTGRRYEIEQIERIQNRTLHFQYKMQKTRMAAENPGIPVERHLWHGTSETSVDSINVYGFSRSYTGKNATVYGEGSYFAVSPKYSARSTYSPPDSRGRRRMYMVAVLTGHYTKGYRGMRTPPARDPLRPHLKYDTVVDNMSEPNMFVVFNDVQAYPEYLITFRKR